MNRFLLTSLLILFASLLKPMPSLQEWREVLNWHDATDEELEEFVGEVRRIINVYLDHYLRDLNNDSG